jgi:1,4-dihydroxy-2-naphthoate polyprenyltransferase
VLRTWWLAIRPKTLLAAFAPIAVGTAVAFREEGLDLVAAIAALVVALSLQITANLANDLFDFHRGADVDRMGPTRVTQSGLVSTSQIRRATALSVVIAVLAGLVLVMRGGWPILVLGIAAILAALAYTAGPYPLGYHGLGDLFVFLFFGLVGVTGSAYVQTEKITRLSLLAAIPVGFLVTAIIVVNNLRDIDTDRAAGKHTLAVKLGRVGTIAEYRLLLMLSFLITPMLFLIDEIGWGWILPWGSLILALPLMRRIAMVTGPALNPVLGKTAQLALVFSLLFAIGIAL